MKRYLKIAEWAIILLLTIIPFMTPSVALPEADPCPQIVQQALQTTTEVCSSVNRNQACYGHVMLEASPQPYVDLFQFDTQGDVVNVEQVKSIRLNPMDLTEETWGIALMRIQANLPASQPGQNVTLLLFGNVEIENAATPAPEVETTVNSSGKLNVRQRPLEDAFVLGTVSPGETVIATARTADDAWVRIEVPGQDITGWVAGWAVAPDVLAAVDTIEAWTRRPGPMQAIYLRSGVDDAFCPEAPNSGLVIQTPEGEARVTFLINEIDIQLGSTVYFQAEPGDVMAVRVVEGSAQVRASGVISTAFAGMEIMVPVSEDLQPSGPPSPPAAYKMPDVAALPITLLPRAISIHAPATPEDIARAVATPEWTATPSEDEVVGDDDIPVVDGAGESAPAPTEASDEKIIICHKGNTITISPDALPAHLAHGDTLGPCP